MNLLLVDADELDGDRVVLRDRRATHLRTVIGAVVGATVRAGIVGGPLGTAEVLADDGTAITLRLATPDPPSEPMPVELLLAIPRPKVLSRALEIAASFAVARITLTNAWRVDKSYLTTPRLEPAALAEAARLGAEQGGTTHVAPIAVHKRLMPLLDERFPAASARDRAARASLKLIAHPDAPPIESAMRGGPITLAIGAEGGWIQREVDTFVERGFRPVSLGQPVLRVEAAIAAALGQLALLARVRER